MNKLYPDFEYNGVSYSIFSGANDTGTRHFTFCPYNGDFDDYECKNVEYVDTTLGGNGYVHSYYEINEIGETETQPTF